MKFLEYLNEDYAFRVKDNSNRSYEVFINPSAKELRDCKDEYDSVRFAANFKTKKLYVWNGDLTHVDFAWNSPKDVDLDEQYVAMGTAIVKGNKLEFEDLQTEPEMKPRYLKMSDKWLDRWFESSFVASVKDVMG